MLGKNKRKTGIDIIGDVGWGTHFCQFYETKEDLISILVPYFKAGLENNEFCMWVTSEPLIVEEAKDLIKRIRRGEHIEHHETVRVTKDGRKIDVSVTKSPIRDMAGNITGISAISRDITEHKQIAKKKENLNMILTTTRNINEMLIRVKNEDELFRNACDLLLNMEYVKFIWIGLIDKAILEVKPVAHAGFIENYPPLVRVRTDDPAYISSPTGIATKTGEVVVINDTEDDYRCKSSGRELAKKGVMSILSIPLKYTYDKEAMGVITVYSDKRHALDDEEVKYLVQVAGDITISLRSLQLEKELERGVNNLRESLNSTIEAISLMGKIRDPYTSGHENRVSQLACAIARESGFGEDRVEGIRICAFLHDIGKIAVPSEILSKPGALNEHEYGIIKTHPKVGYNILKNLKFPWPVAQAALQHHETINGTGYPMGMKGKDILTEARILAVAGTVEAMVNHRPYRPSLGIDKALEEITNNKGTLYDPSVVDACLKLFKEKGFRFAEGMVTI